MGLRDGPQHALDARSQAELIGAAFKDSGLDGGSVDALAAAEKGRDPEPPPASPPGRPKLQRIK